MPRNAKADTTGAGGREKVQDDVKRVAEIFDEYGDEIRAMILFNVNDESEADDIFQSLFLSLVRKPPPLGVEGMRGYLYRAIINDVLDAVRRTKSYQGRLHRYADHLRFTELQEGPDSIAAKAEEVKKILQLVEAQLPRHQATAVTQRYRYGRGTREAAEKMGVHERTFSRYLCMGLKKIRQLLGENEKDNGKA